MALRVLNDWRKKEKLIFCDTQELYEIQISVCYLNTDSLIHLLGVYNGFHTITAEYLKQRQYGLQSLKHLLYSLVANSGLECIRGFWL